MQLVSAARTVWSSHKITNAGSGIVLVITNLTEWKTAIRYFKCHKYA